MKNWIKAIAIVIGYIALNFLGAFFWPIGYCIFWLVLGILVLLGILIWLIKLLHDYFENEK